MEIILTNTSSKPIYEQITSQIKAMILKGELKPGDAMPSMRKLAKGTFVSAENQEFIREENLRKIEDLLISASELAKQNTLSLEELQRTLTLIYTEES